MKAVKRPIINHVTAIPKINNNEIALNKPTRIVFYLDGLFLYLESYFWLLSLYLIAQQDIMQLGLLVVGLTLLLAALFWLIKGRIDAYPANTIFQLAIIGYALSWLLRGLLNSSFDLGSDTSESFILSAVFNPIFSSDINYPIILLIAFLTSFFRLSFNKRFFDHVSLLKYNASNTQQSETIQPAMIQHLLDKSTLSQLGIFVFFTLLGFVLFTLSMPTSLSIPTTINNQLSWIYTAAAPLVLLYGFYSQPLKNTQGSPSCIR